MPGGRTEDGEAEGLLEALHRFFLWCYHEAIQRDYPLVHTVFPLSGSSRLDLVHVPTSGRAHFVYSVGDGQAHRAYMRALTVGGPGLDLGAETAHVERALDMGEFLVHFVLEPPFSERFEDVRKRAAEAALRHARRAIRN